MQRVNFVCPVCGAQTLEEVLINVTESSEVLSMTPDEISQRDNPEKWYEQSRVDRFDCVSCEYVLQMDNGENVTTVKELYEWLDKKGMLGPEEN